MALNEAKEAVADIYWGLKTIGHNAVYGTGRRVHAVVSSPWLHKLVIGTTLFVIAGVLLYIPAALGYFFLYYKFLPTLETTVPVHLQYGYVHPLAVVDGHSRVQAFTDHSVGPNPFGVASFKGIANRQPYDITVSLTLPRSPPNLDRGNFMLALHLLSPGPTASEAASKAASHATSEAASDAASDVASDTVPIITTSKSVPYLLPSRPLSDPSAEPPPSSSSSWHSLDALLQPTRLDLPAFLASHTIVHTTARPALIPYVDPLASLASRILFLGYHLLAPRGAAAVRLTVPMAEGLAFSAPRHDAARLLPDSLLLEVQAGQAIQVYDARVTIVARLRGLRAFMYRWRVTAFVLFTAAFWVLEMTVMVVGLVVVGWTFGGGGKEVEKEGSDEGGSDEEEEEGEGGDNDDDDDEEDGGESGGSGSSEIDDGGDWGYEEGRAVKFEVKDGTEDPSSSTSGTTMIKKEEGVEDTKEMGNIPSLETGSSTDADDENEVKQEEGLESKDLDIGTQSSSSQVREGFARRRNLLSSEDILVHGNGD
ncbi:putative adipose-regulatory protein-domain-containing protein [Chaetomium tenue]|uniref:Adipose-regulatory protein-domain-containing protein n=1 Tax=Chaetomium tenue TaxID=1854479 RepID=A0ACB7NW55_9PEZI|nr:putative adipose-regulatory protein-domain-containing protein [Chaetomium globosum]